MSKESPQSQSKLGHVPRQTLAHKAARYLEREIDLGLDHVPSGWSAAPRPQTAGSETVQASPPPSAAASDDLLLEPAIRGAESLEELRAVLGDCTRCKLSTGRAHIVFGTGNPKAEVMFVGEGPGEEEDRQGLPFVGKAGGLLTDIITKGMGMARDDVYIANVVKCRPPDNRNPELDEISACEPFLKRQIAVIQPRVIVTLGKFATQLLLRSRMPISKLRGQWSEYGGVAVMPTFHPAYLLRSPSEKRVVWEDIKKVLERLGRAAPQRAR